MGKTKVAFFAEILIRDFDGATRTMFQIIDRIDQSKFEFIFFCGVPPIGEFPHKVIHIPTFTIPFNKTYQMASMVGMGPKIEKSLDQFSPDVVHIATPSPLGYFGLKYAWTHHVPVLSIYHTHFISYIKYYTKNTPIVTRAFEELMVLHNKSFYDKCNLIYMPTDEMTKQLRGRGFKTNRMKLWRRGIDLDLFNPDKRNKAYIRSIVGNDKENILFVSRLVWEKNLETLIRMYNHVQKCDFNFIIAGDGVALSEMKNRMRGAIFLKHVPQLELSKLYASSDYFVFPSTTETYGNVVAEAMASGLPCIVADGGGVKSFINHGVNGFLCAPNDELDYLRMIEILRHQPVLKENIAKRALTDVASLKWDELVKKYFCDVNILAQTPLSNDVMTNLGIAYH